MVRQAKDCFSMEEKMIKLYENGVYLVNGKEIVEDSGDVKAALQEKAGQAPAKEDAAKGTMAYGILK